MIRKTLIFFALLITSANILAVEKEWRFQVFLDDKKIGYHELILRKVDNQFKLKSEANFEYRLMFVKLYGYQHKNTEVSEPELVQLEVRGTMQPAYRYLLGAGELQIELWYSENKEWLALETEARGGRRLRYELL